MGLYFLALKHSPEGNHIPLWIAKESLKQEHGFSTLLCDNSDLLINLLDQLVPCTDSFNGHYYKSAYTQRMKSTSHTKLQSQM